MAWLQRVATCVAATMALAGCTTAYRPAHLTQTAADDTVGYSIAYARAANNQILLAAGKLDSAEAVANRQALYAGAATEAHEIGRTEAYSMPRLPAYPCDGGTPCLTNCKCSWSIDETAKEWRATWLLGGAREHCAGCRDRAQEYGPLVIAKPEKGAAA